MSYDLISWSNIPLGPEFIIGRILTWTEDRGPWYRRIWRGHWRRYVGHSLSVPLGYRAVWERGRLVAVPEISAGDDTREG